MISMANESNIYSRPLAFDSEGMSSFSFWFSVNLALIFIWFIFRNRCRFHWLWFHWRHHYQIPLFQRDCMKWMDHLFHCLTDLIVFRWSCFHDSIVVWSVNFFWFAGFVSIHSISWELHELFKGIGRMAICETFHRRRHDLIKIIMHVIMWRFVFETAIKTGVRRWNTNGLTISTDLTHTWSSIDWTSDTFFFNNYKLLPNVDLEFQSGMIRFNGITGIINLISNW